MLDIARSAFMLEAGVVPYRLPNDLVTASDSYMGDVTSRITSTIASLPSQPNITATSAPTFDVDVAVQDISGNRAVKVVQVTLVDTRSPSLLAVNIDWEGGKTWRDPGLLRADDLVDGDLRSRAKTSIVSINRRPLPALPTCEYSSAGEFDPAPAAYISPTISHESDVSMNVYLAADSVVTLSYSVTDDAGNEAKVSRQVKIVDTQSPEIALVPPGAMHITLEHGAGAYAERGVNASDALDGDITAWVCVDVVEYPPTPAILRLGRDARGQTTSGFDRTSFALGDRTALPTSNLSAVLATMPVGTLFDINFAVADGVDHRVSTKRSVLVVDTTPPVVRLQGGSAQQSAVVVPFGTAYREPGADAWDLSDGNLAAYVAVTGSNDVNVWWPRDYSVSYRVRDRYDNVASVSRTVSVRPFELPPPRYRVRLELDAPPRPAQALEVEQALSHALGGSFVFLVTWRAADDRQAGLNLLPNMTAAARGNYRRAGMPESGGGRRRRLLSNEHSVMEFVARDAFSFEWMLATKVIDRLGLVDGDANNVSVWLNATVILVAPATSSASPSSESGATIGAVVAVVLCIAIIVGAYLSWKRRQRGVNAKANGEFMQQHGEAPSTSMYNNPMYEDWHNRKTPGGRNATVSQEESYASPKEAGSAPEPEAGAASAPFSPPLRTALPSEEEYDSPRSALYDYGNAVEGNGVVVMQDSYNTPKADAMSPRAALDNYIMVETTADDEGSDVAQSYMVLEPSSAERPPSLPDSYDALGTKRGPAPLQGYDVLSAAERPPSLPDSYDALGTKRGPAPLQGYDVLSAAERPPSLAGSYDALGTKRGPAPSQSYHVLSSPPHQLPQAYGIAAVLRDDAVTEAQDEVQYALPSADGAPHSAERDIMPAMYGIPLALPAQDNYTLTSTAAREAGASGSSVVQEGYARLVADAAAQSGLATGKDGYDQLKAELVEPGRYGHAVSAFEEDAFVYSPAGPADTVSPLRAIDDSLKADARQHVAFHGPMSRGTAESILRDEPKGSFILRFSTSTAGVVVSIVPRRGRCDHHVVSVSDGAWHLNDAPLEDCASLQDALARMARGCGLVRGKATLPVARSADDGLLAGPDLDSSVAVGSAARAIHVHDHDDSGLAERGAPTYLHGLISRSEAEQRLRDAGTDDGTFLVRVRETSVVPSFAVAMLHKGRVSHHLLEQSAPGRPFRINAERAEGCLTLDATVDFMKAKPGPHMPGRLIQAVACPEGGDTAQA
jgi:hypothetical protein